VAGRNHSTTNIIFLIKKNRFIFLTAAMLYSTILAASLVENSDGTVAQFRSDGTVTSSALIKSLL
jgi:hypothetical protein